MSDLHHHRATVVRQLLAFLGDMLELWNPRTGGAPAPATAPLCANCTIADPTIWKTCPTCGDSGQLLAQDCSRCRLRRRVDELLTDADGTVRPELHTLHEALVGVDRPATALSWLSRSAAIAVLGELAAGTRPLTHAALDELPASKTLAHLRAVLVATHALPARDEHLTQLEALDRPNRRCSQ